MGPRRKIRRTAPATEVLRRAVAESGLSFAELERRSGVRRQSLMKFAKGEQSLRLDIVRLDIADKLMDCLGLDVVRRVE